MAIQVDISKDKLVKYTLQLADNSMILGQRLSEWCGHGPILEQDIAMTNIALDYIGEARSLYQYAAEVEGNGKTEDFYPYQRDVLLWQNVLLVEQPNDDFAHTMVRQFLYDLYHYNLLSELQQSTDSTLSAIASKSIKEATYHLKFSSEWMIRLGDGTEESHHRMQTALDNRIMYFEEQFSPTQLESELTRTGVAPDLALIKERAYIKLNAICSEATLTIPEVKWPQSGGKEGRHSEHFGFILAELQFMQKSYPGATW